MLSIRSKIVSKTKQKLSKISFGMGREEKRYRM